MTRPETNNFITEKTKITVELRLLWAIIGSSFVVCCCVLGAYYGFKADIKELRDDRNRDILLINWRLDHLEKK